MNSYALTPITSRRGIRAAGILTTLAAALTLAMPMTGCVVKEQVVVREAPVHVQVRHVPAPIAEDRGAWPGPGWNWVPGHWKWEGRDWAWVHGRWVQQVVPTMPVVIVEPITPAPSPQHYWVPGHWVWRIDSSGWFWIKGSWHS